MRIFDVTLYSLLFVSGAVAQSSSYSGPRPHIRIFPIYWRPKLSEPTEPCSVSVKAQPFIIQGPKSPARMKLVYPTFLIETDELRDFGLYRLKTETDHRELIFQRDDGHNLELPMLVTRLDGSLYRLDVVDELASGEYALFPNLMNFAFCFGVIGATVPIVAQNIRLKFRDAVDDGDVATVKTMLKDNPSLAFVEDADGCTPLHWVAIKGGYKDLAELLIANKAEIDTRTHTGSTPLHLAALNTHTELVLLLLADGADVHAVDEYGDTPLHFAVSGFGFDKNIVESLLAKGADVNARDMNGSTPLSFAVFNARKSAAELLRTRGGHE